MSKPSDKPFDCKPGPAGSVHDGNSIECSRKGRKSGCEWVNFPLAFVTPASPCACNCLSPLIPSTGLQYHKCVLYDQQGEYSVNVIEAAMSQGLRIKENEA